MKYRAPLVNSQSVLAVQGIQGSLVSSFIVARALITMGSEDEDEAIFSVKAESIAWM